MKRSCNHKVYLGALVALVVVLLQGWIGDGLKGDSLFPWLPGGPLKYGDECFSALMITLSILTLIFTWGLIHQRHNFLPIVVQRISEPGQVSPRPHLVLAVSWSHDWTWTAQQLESRKGKPPLPLPPDLEGALATMATLGDQNRFTWEQLLRAIQPHTAKLTRLTLICSSGQGGTEADTEQHCTKMIRHYFPHLPANAIECRAVDFDSLDELLRTYRLIATTGPEREIVIDVTGGNKIISIAAAMVTLEHPDMEFQYVETSGKKRVISFNVTAGKPGSAL